MLEGESGSLESSNHFDQGINPKFHNRRITPKMKSDMIEMFKGHHGLMTAEMIALSVGITVRRVLELKRQFMHTGNIKATHKNRHSISFERRKALQNQLVTNLIRTNRNITLKEIQHRMKDEGHWMSLASISSVLKKLGFMHRSTSIKVSELRNSENIVQERYDFSHWLEDKPNEMLFYTDFYRFDVPDFNLHGLQTPQKQQPVKTVVTLYLTVGFSGIVGYNIVKHEPSSKFYVEHIFQNFAEVHDETDILMINADTCHSDINFQKMIDETKIRIKLLPLLSPYLSPICNVFNQIKSVLWQTMSRNLIENTEKMIQNVESIISEYPVSHIRRSYEEMREAVKLCRKRQEI